MGSVQLTNEHSGGLMQDYSCKIQNPFIVTSLENFQWVEIFLELRCSLTLTIQFPLLPPCLHRFKTYIMD